ncbi:hypothetical protein NKI38_25915 [Mesorhizobium sp. M0621]|uniref:hypothetical protein n=1 Tax=Mesorhizobium sp. M0621 TaxID=2956974 RepID=UPI00333C78F4
MSEARLQNHFRQINPATTGRLNGDRLFGTNKLEANVVVEAENIETRIGRHIQAAAAEPIDATNTAGAILLTDSSVFDPLCIHLRTHQRKQIST